MGFGKYTIEQKQNHEKKIPKPYIMPALFSIQATHKTSILRVTISTAQMLERVEA